MYPILNIFIHFGDIRRRTSKSSEIGPHVACFCPWNFLGMCSKILDRHYKTGPSTDHRAKFHADRPTHLGDLALKTSVVKLKSFRKLSFPGGLKRVKETPRCLVTRSRYQLSKLLANSQLDKIPNRIFWWSLVIQLTPNTPPFHPILQSIPGHIVPLVQTCLSQPMLTVAEYR